MKRLLIDDWKQAWKWFSVQGLAVLTVVPVIYENTSFLQDFISPAAFHWGTGALGALTLLSRLVKQSDS